MIPLERSFFFATARLEMTLFVNVLGLDIGFFLGGLRNSTLLPSTRPEAALCCDGFEIFHAYLDLGIS